MRYLNCLRIAPAERLSQGVQATSTDPALTPTSRPRRVPIAMGISRAATAAAPRSRQRQTISRLETRKIPKQSPRKKLNRQLATQRSKLAARCAFTLCIPEYNDRLVD